VELDGQYIDADATLRTSQAHIWAAGDVVGAYPFTHVASRQGALAWRNAFSENPEGFDYTAVPWVTYTDPALAHVGRTEEELRRDGVDYEVESLSFDEIPRAIVTGETDGLVKVLSTPSGDILGGHILGRRADDLIAPIVLAMRNGLSVSALADTIFPYPTRAEALAFAANSL
jgi:pyruvate/2-oxoglutarate dehydrogenase complex dihydrolipoamide dehydrogenase (E3) component